MAFFVYILYVNASALLNHKQSGRRLGLRPMQRTVSQMGKPSARLMTIMRYVRDVFSKITLSRTGIMRIYQLVCLFLLPLQMRSYTVKYCTLIAGLLVAACVILSQSVSVKVSPTDEVTQSGNAEAGATEQEAVSYISVTSLPAPTVIHFTHQAVCLFEIFFTDETSDQECEPVAYPLTKFFSTLLSVIISPNAP
jgi:hypothetical protein